jgi:taurine dioxygenase
MAQPSLNVVATTAALGAEISGVSLADLDDATFAEIHTAWLEHQVLFFRDQDLTPDQHKAFGRRFGELQVHPFLQSRKDEGHPEIIVLESDADRPTLAAGWHTDVTFLPNPPMGSILRAVEAPAVGGDTMWSSMYAAYEALSSTMQRLLSDLVAIHDTAKTFSRDAYPADKHPEPGQMPSTEHPLVRTHPETGRKSLFVNRAFTSRIVGMRRRESETLLNFLYDLVGTPEFTCRFRWEKNSIAIWDNRCTQHRAVADNAKAHRRMERVTIEGDRPV